ncbi:MAG TPA: C4-type zinc ribbon domain-containing protein [Mycobacteriales bacterium]|jgi:hypothetical protein|nr:C4-type zinc ribbon domain-containing protein [Mycobacteriales bacterium]
MKATPAIQLRLLDVQAVDTARNQLTHRRNNLPELAELERLNAEVSDAEGSLEQFRERVGDLDKQIRALEFEVETVQARAQRDKSRMDSGAISSPRELESMQHEVQTLAAKQGELEDRELEIMEQRDAVDVDLSAAAQRFQQLRGEYYATIERRNAALAEIDVEDSRREAERTKLVAELPADLLELYERLRASNGGVGASALRAKRCQGCQLELFGTALAELKAAPEDEVVRCDECGRILIRTPESGL